jgi:hypothetical protein
MGVLLPDPLEPSAALLTAAVAGLEEVAVDCTKNVEMEEVVGGARLGAVGSCLRSKSTRKCIARVWADCSQRVSSRRSSSIGQDANKNGWIDEDEEVKLRGRAVFIAPWIRSGLTRVLSWKAPFPL